MTCTSYEFDANKPGNIRDMILLSDSTPAAFPTTTAGIAGLPTGNFPIAPGTLLIVVKTGKLYVMNEAGSGWNEFGAGEE